MKLNLAPASLLHHEKKRLEGDGKKNIKILRVASTRQLILNLFIQQRRKFVIGTHGKDDIHPFQMPTWKGNGLGPGGGYNPNYW